jgi:hypothetical protein
MKMMFDLMTLCAQQLNEYVEKAAQKDDSLEMKDVMAKFTTDVIGLCAFGLHSNAINDSDSEFRQMGRQVFKSSPLAALKGIIEMIFPSLMKRFHVNNLPDAVSNFFIRTVKDVIEYREKNNVSRNDFMQLIIELKNKGKVQDDEPPKSEEALDGTFHKASEIDIGEYTVFYISEWIVTLLKRLFFFLEKKDLLSLILCLQLCMEYPFCCVLHVGRRSDQLLIGRVGAVFPMGWRKCDGKWKSSLKIRRLFHSEINVHTMKNGFFWVVTPCGSCKNRRFGGTWRLLHQGDKNR